MRAVALAPGEGLAYESPTAGVLTVKVTGADSGGTVTAFEVISPPDLGPPLHVHDQDEWIYTTVGTFTLRVDDQVVEAAPGTSVFIPRGTPHTWRNIGTEMGRFAGTITPASPAFEAFFAHFAALAPEARGPDAFRRLAVETGAMEVVGPPLGA